MNQHLRPVGLTLTQFSLLAGLYWLSRQGEAVTQQQLTDAGDGLLRQAYAVLEQANAQFFGPIQAEVGLFNQFNCWYA